MIIRLAGLAGLLHGLTTVMAISTEQAVLAPDNLADFVRGDGNLPTLADLLTLEGRASIFYSYARETDMSALFTQSVTEGEGTTVFVPTNKAVQALARKPHEDPEGNMVAVTDAEHEAASKENVQRWVGAHIIPSPDVDFTSSKPYNTLTAGATISFSAMSSRDHPEHEAIIDTDATHLRSVKGGPSSHNTDSSHMAAGKGCPDLDEFIRRNPRYANSSVRTDAAHLASIKGPASPEHEGTHMPNTKGSSMQTPIWKQYELNDGVHIISEKKASNGVMYLIDGTVPV
ncbi:hypothetical protein JB92DRAFT_3015871 [Gautieria morchelliformis]|nr:hypothetical protein JB92DRAFT_3015871 [Gautieria morchelliformis]